MQSLLGFTSEARWLRPAHDRFAGMFPYLPGQSGYNKRLRALAGPMNWLIGVLARDTSVWTDDVWVVDSTPVECGRSRETARRSDLAGWAEYGYCASRKGEPERPGAQFFKPLRQVIESINDTFKGQLDLERHGGRTKAGVIVRVWQRILALTAAIWHNDRAGQPIPRSLTAYDH